MKLIESLNIQEDSLRLFLSNYNLDKSPKTQLIKDYLDTLNTYWTEILSQLEALDLYLLMSTFTKDGVDVYNLLENMDKITIQESINRLEKLSLCTLRLNITHLKMSPRLYMYDEVRHFFTQDEKIKSFASFQKSLSQIDILTSHLQYGDLPEDIIHFFYSYGFYVPVNVLEQSFTPNVLEYLKTLDILKKTMIIQTNIPQETIGYLCYTIPYSIEDEKLNDIKQIRSYQSQVINDLARLVFQIQKDGLKITKKDEMSKKSLEKFYKIIPHEGLLWFLLQFLKQKHYLELIEGETYKVAESFLIFFKKSLKETYDELLKTDPILQEIVIIIQGMSSSFISFADILLAYLKKNSSMLKQYMEKRELRRSLLQKVELLHYLGILDQGFSPKGISFYTLSPFYKHSYNYHVIPKPILTVSTSFQIMGDMQQIPPQVSYMLSLFGDIESLSPALAFKIDQQTFHRALYFGFNINDLIDILNHYAKTSPDAFLVQSLELWSRNFKVGKLNEGIVLHATSSILDELEHKPEYSLYIKKRIAPEYALVSSELKAKKILDKSFMYFFLD